jgi:peptidoglycan/LPS O-acetylase OafA/YrhL
MDKPKRRYDLDWLRVVAVLLLVPFHSALIFSLDLGDIVYVKDVVESPPLVEMANFMWLFHMPLLFVIAGSSVWFALKFRSAGRYLVERFTRLVIPLVFGITVPIPLMIYVQFMDGSKYDSFWDFYVQFFRINLDDLSGYSGAFTPAHLWFVLFLFAFAVVALPLFLVLRRESGKRLIGKLAAFFQLPGTIFLLALPLAGAVEMFDIGGKAPFLYLVLFIYGYILVADERFQDILDQHAVSGAILGVVFTTAFQIVLAVDGSRLLVHLAYYVSRWCWVVAILGFGHRYLNKSNRLLRYLSEASYPFYILHLPVNTIVGYFVIRWPASIAIKFVVINVVTTLATYAVYEVLVKRIGVMRFLFGIKPRFRPIDEINSDAIQS